jgi:cytochrome c biogenesis protein CcdA
MNSTRQYVKNQETKRKKKINGKKNYLVTSKVTNRVELTFPIVVYLFFVGVVIYLMQYQGIEEIGTTIDFIIAVMSIAIMLMSHIRESLRKHRKSIWIVGSIYIILMTVGLIAFMIIGVELKDASTIARVLSFIALIITAAKEIMEVVKLEYTKNIEWEQKQEEQIRKIELDSITKF